MLHHHPHSRNTAELWPGVQIKISIEKKPSLVVCDRPMSGKLWAKGKISSSKLGILTKHKMSPLDIASRGKGNWIQITDSIIIKSWSKHKDCLDSFCLPAFFTRETRLMSTFKSPFHPKGALYVTHTMVHPIHLSILLAPCSSVTFIRRWFYGQDNF